MDLNEHPSNLEQDPVHNEQTFQQFDPLSPQPPRILIVDDTPVNLSVMVDSLKNCNYRLVTAQDGTEALQRAAFIKPDLILLDVMMPEMDGFDVCRHLKNNAETADIPVIFMTALAETEHKVIGFKVGGADYITKPIQIAEVIARVNTHLNLRTMQRQLQAQNAQLQKHQAELEQRVLHRTAELSNSNRLLREEIEARKRVEEALVLGKREFRTLAENLPDPIYRYTPDGHPLYANPAVERISGRPPFSRQDNATSNTDTVMECIRRVVETGEQVELEAAYINPDGHTLLFHNRYTPEFGPNGEVVSVLSINHDITERKLMERTNQTHLRFFESMDRINRAIQGASNLSRMMSDVLDVVLTIFDCDRAYLMYPCDPEANSWRVPMERNRPGYPGVSAAGPAIPMDAEVAATLRLMLNNDSPVQFSPGTGHTVPMNVSDRFGIKSFLSMALYPKRDKPWQFGIHQCAYARVWTPDEEKLLQEIGRRLADGLTSQLSYRNVKESEQKFRTLAENSPDNIARFDRQARLIYMNPRLEQTLGKSSQALLGKTPKEKYPGGELDEYQAKVESVIGTGRSDDLELIIPDNVEGLRYYHIHFVAERGPDGEIIGALAMGRNYTQKRLMELELVRREREHRTLVENTPNIIIRYDRDYRRTYVNRTDRALAGITTANVLGKTPQELWPLASPNALEFTCLLERVVETCMMERINVELKDDNGLLRYFDMHLVPELGDHDEVISVLSISSDITDIKIAEQQREEASKQAERQLREFSSHLQSVREEEKTSIAREIHDNLGGTLTALKMDLNWLMDELAANEKAAPLLKHVESMSQLLDNATIVTRQVITDLRPPLLDDFGLPAALEWQAAQFQKRTGIQCRVSYAESYPYELDKSQTINLFRIFQESLTNIARHSGASRVDVELQHKNTEFILTISDNGCGLTEAHITSPTSYGMLGMRERTEQLGGRINFYNPPGGGFSITVILPRPTDNKNKEKS